MTTAPGTVAEHVLAVSCLDAVPTLLQVMRVATSLDFAAVAHVSSTRWTACAVSGEFGAPLNVGDDLELYRTVCCDSRALVEPIFVDRASIDLRYQHRGGSLYPFESFLTVPMVLANGDYFGNLCAMGREPNVVSDDRTRFMAERFATLVALQLDSQQVQRQAHSALLDERAASELREQFIAILGHDLRNPLQAIFASSDLLERRLAATPMSAIASRIKTSARRMSALIDDVLDFARKRLGSGIGVQMQMVESVESELTAIVQEFQEGQPDRQILSNISVTRAIRCDIRRIQQVASNLIGNALAHGSRASPVRISADNNEQYLVLQVWNAGEPIPAASIDKVFEPFWRQSTTTDRQGLGLGLHICSQIVRAHGGQLSVTSTRENGTQFTARLPLNAPLQ